jgi:hypothetical protein
MASRQNKATLDVGRVALWRRFFIAPILKL